MGNRSGLAVSVKMAPLLVLLFICGIAAAPLATKNAYLDARKAVDRGLYDEAAVRAQTALARAGPVADEWIWALRILNADVQYRQGGQKQTEAAALLRRELPPSFRESEAALRRLIALVQVESRHDAKAREYGKQALALAEAKYPRLAWQVHLSFVNLEPTLAKKEARFAKALKLARYDGNLSAIALVHASQSYTFTAARRHREAIDAGEKALQTFKALQATGRIAQVAGNLGWAYSELGDLETARSYFVEAEEAATRAGTPKGRLNWENQLGNVYLFEHKYAEAEQYYTRALITAHEVDESQVPMIQTNLARNALERGLPEEAERHIAAALAWATEKDRDAPGAQIVDARIATLRRDFRGAERILRVSAVAKDLPLAIRVEAQTYLAQLYAQMRRSDLAEQNFLAAIASVREARAGISDELRLSFFNTSIDLFNSYIDFLLNNQRVEDALAATELIRAQSLAEGLDLRAAPRKLDARAVAKQRNAVILSYWLSPSRSHVWIISASGVDYAALPGEKEIEKQARSYRRMLLGYNGTLRKSGAEGQQLYRAVVAPVASRIPRGARVYVIASGVLHGINFETLVVPGTPEHYWIEDAIVTNASSLQLLAQSSARKYDRSMLLVGDPPAAGPTLPKLPFAPQEMEGVGKHFASKVVLAGANATPAAYRASKPGRFGYMHFVAHGLSSERRPLDSCVILARDAHDNFKLMGHDILAQKLEARLVTLSSCHGAGERMYAGEGLVGLAWAFLGAGAAEVIAALWEVDDTATPRLMDQMYGQIAAGVEPAVALRNAKLSLLKGKGPHQRPQYWAPFVLYSGG